MSYRNLCLRQVTGHYAFVDPVGEEVSVRYEADHEGFRAESDAIPQVSRGRPGEFPSSLRCGKVACKFVRMFVDSVRWAVAMESSPDMQNLEISFSVTVLQFQNWV